MLRELAWMDAELEPPEPEQPPLMSDDEFEHEVATVAAGGWEAVGLDSLPAGWAPASIEDLRNAD